MQPLKTSMPRTCERDSSVSTVLAHCPSNKSVERKHVSNVIERLFNSRNVEMLRSLIIFSIDSLQKDFFEGQHTTELNRMRETTGTAKHCSLLVQFFLLLNVDAGLKEHIMDLDIDTNKAKLVRFMTDLRRVLVLEFYTDDSQSLQGFVDACEEAYVLA